MSSFLSTLFQESKDCDVVSDSVSTSSSQYDDSNIDFDVIDKCFSGTVVPGASVSILRRFYE